MPYNYILNKITTKTDKTYIGIIDYTTKKHLYFFDFTNEPNVDYTLLTIMWKGNSAGMRFSVFCAIHYPTIELPNVVIVPYNNIKEIYGKYDEHLPPSSTLRKKIVS